MSAITGARWLCAGALLACSSAPHDVPVRRAEEPAPAVPTPEVAPRAVPPAPEPALDVLGDASQSTSIGSVTNGRLEGGVALPKSGPGYRYNDRRDENARYGTAETVRSIARAARVVREAAPGSELVVNDVGLLSGGPIAHHGSHRAGRDADILFYLLGDDEKPTPSVGTPLDLEGVGFDFKDLSTPDDDVRVHLDAPRTWRYVAALLADPEAPVQRIFVVEHVRTMLLREAAVQQADPNIVARFSDVTCQPGYPHDDHLHVRWFCTAEDLGKGCEDIPPLYPWRADELHALGLEPVMAQQSRSKEPAKVVTQAEAARNIARQRPHASVLAFMKRRRAWEKAPHPGRPYCR